MKIVREHEFRLDQSQELNNFVRLKPSFLLHVDNFPASSKRVCIKAERHESFSDIAQENPISPERVSYFE
jgi:hypothetical protein